MSLFDRQSLAIISVAHGSLLQIYENYSFGTEFNSKIWKCCEILDHICKSWPVEDDRGMLLWMNRKMVKWEKSRPDINSKKGILEYIALSMASITDLDERLKEKARKERSNPNINSTRRELLDPVFASLQDCLYWIDENGEQFGCFDSMVPLMKKLHYIIELY